MGRTVAVQWVKGMKVEGTVGRHRLVMDAPAEAGGGDEAPSPAELLCAPSRPDASPTFGGSPTVSSGCCAGFRLA